MHRNIWMTKDNQNIRVFQSEIDSYLQLGWVIGRYVSDSTRQAISKKNKGNTPWNKGLSNWMSEEQRQSIILSCKTRILSDETRKKKSNSMLGKNKGRKISLEGRLNMSIGGKGKAHPVSCETRIKMKLAQNNPELRERVSNIKRLNNSFNTSKPEEDYYQYLLTKYDKDDIIRQYKDDRYPFNCDFYIKSEDRFIEINKHWTHGGKPYNPNDEECQCKLNEWLLKSETSQFYKNAIETWTIRDVQKQKYAENNHIQLEVIY